MQGLLLVFLECKKSSDSVGHLYAHVKDGPLRGSLKLFLASAWPKLKILCTYLPCEPDSHTPGKHQSGTEGCGPFRDHPMQNQERPSKFCDVICPDNVGHRKCVVSECIGLKAIGY
jgi:hypothetical protein